MQLFTWIIEPVKNIQIRKYRELSRISDGREYWTVKKLETVRNIRTGGNMGTVHSENIQKKL